MFMPGSRDHIGGARLHIVIEERVVEIMRLLGGGIMNNDGRHSLHARGFARSVVTAIQKLRTVCDIARATLAMACFPIRWGCS